MAAAGTEAQPLVGGSHLKVRIGETGISTAMDFTPKRWVKHERIALQPIRETRAARRVVLDDEAVMGVKQDSQRNQRVFS